MRGQAAMHEATIVEALLAAAEGELARSGHTGRIRKLRLTIGPLAGVNAEAVRFAFAVLSTGTKAEAAFLEIEQPKAVGDCRACRTRTKVADLFAPCPECGSGEVTVEGSRELVLQAVEIETEGELEHGDHRGAKAVAGQ